jgi:hypothetical protein
MQLGDYETKSSLAMHGSCNLPVGCCLDAPKVSIRSGLLALGTAWKWHWIDRELQAHVAG